MFEINSFFDFLKEAGIRILVQFLKKFGMRSQSNIENDTPDNPI